MDYAAIYYCAFNKICGDSAGNCYMTGILWGDFTFGGNTLTGSFENENIYVAKANAAGDWQWGMQTYDTGSLFYLGIYDITALNAGNFVIAGVNYSESVNFGDFLVPPSQNPYSFLLRVNGATSAVSDNQSELIPLAVAAYPNPSTSQVKFQIDAKQQVTTSVAIYNIKGQLVKRFPQSAYMGRTDFDWDGTNEDGNRTAPGIYIIRIKTNKGDARKVFTRF